MTPDDRASADRASADAVVAAAHERLALIAKQLTAARARDEGLAELVLRRRWLGFERGEAMHAIERVWRLGVILLGRSGTVYATGSIVRAGDAGYPGHVSVMQEMRREYSSSAASAGFSPGETVNFDAPVIDFSADALAASTGPLLFRDGGLRVRWSPVTDDSALASFDSYLDERVELLLHPPEGA